MQLDRTTVRPHDRIDDRQAQTRAAATPGARRVTAGETLEDFRLQRRRDAWTVIEHRQHHLGVLTGSQRGGDSGSLRRVGARIGQQVGQYLMQSGLVTGDQYGFVGQIQFPRVVGTGDMGVTDRVHDEPGQVDVFALQRPPGVQAGEQQHVLDQLGHALGLGFDAVHGMGNVVGELPLFALCQFGVTADGGQRCSQLVAGVGDELAHPGLTGLSRRQGPGDAVEHAIQGATELSDFGVSSHRIDPDDRGGQPHLTAVEFQVGDLLRSLGNPCQRLELTTDDDDARRRCGHQGDGRPDTEDDQ